MKVAITGARGLFGLGLAQVFSKRHKVVPLTRSDADMTQAEQLTEIFAKIRPEVVVHPAAIPDLDVCEVEPARAYLVNVHGTRHVVEAPAKSARRSCGSRWTQFSTEKSSCDTWN